MKGIIYIFLTFLFFSCATKVQVIKFQEKIPDPALVSLNQVSFNQILSYNHMEKEIRELQESSAKISGLNLLMEKKKTSYQADIAYRDHKYFIGFRQKHSLSMILTMRDEKGNTVIRIYTTEEGGAPLDSLSVIHRITERTWKTLAKSLKIS